MSKGFVSGMSWLNALHVGVPLIYACAPGTVLPGHLVYLSGPGTVALAQANTSATMPVLGVVVSNPSSSTCVVAKQGLLTLPYATALTPNQTVYLDPANAGQVTQTKPTGETEFVLFAGQAVTATSVYFNIDSTIEPPDASTAQETEVFTPVLSQTTFIVGHTISRPEDTMFAIDGVSFVYGSGVGINDFHVVGAQVIWHNTAMTLDNTVTVSITYKFDVSA